ncbi:septation initiation protein [Enterobacter sp. RHB15-C17]|uniref:phage polarity suppression protein n=1 Tax=Lelliottia amnigena TaxID=61646 RepID=UPI0015EA5FA0|nr:septation initiation protein [Lelliottia amnigena]QMM51446.1 septation initiation protein [Enterobacter sp. RHB15-C17]UJD93226.1 septation initiation protein [Lelliottia amnigena]
MTIPQENTSRTPAVSSATQLVLEKANSAKSTWMDSRRKQTEAAEMIANIRKRRDETESETKAQNEEWRQMFHDNQGQVTAAMKTLRADIALGREMLDEFDELLATHAGENEFLPWKTAELAQNYIRAHETLVETHLAQLWENYMQQHGQYLIQLLSLIKVTKGRSASSVIGVVHSVNDPETVLRDFVAAKITAPALAQEASLQEDPFLREIGVFADNLAYHDVQKAPSPAAQMRIKNQREKAKKGQL